MTPQPDIKQEYKRIKQEYQQRFPEKDFDADLFQSWKFSQRRIAELNKLTLVLCALLVVVCLSVL